MTAREHFFSLRCGIRQLFILQPRYILTGFSGTVTALHWDAYNPSSIITGDSNGVLRLFHPNCDADKLRRKENVLRITCVGEIITLNETITRIIPSPWGYKDIILTLSTNNQFESQTKSDIDVKSTTNSNVAALEIWGFDTTNSQSMQYKSIKLHSFPCSDVDIMDVVCRTVNSSFELLTLTKSGVMRIYPFEEFLVKRMIKQLHEFYRLNANDIDSPVSLSGSRSPQSIGHEIKSDPTLFQTTNQLVPSPNYYNHNMMNWSFQFLKPG